MYSIKVTEALVIKEAYTVDSASKVVNCIPYRVSVQYVMLFHVIS